MRYILTLLRSEILLILFVYEKTILINPYSNQDVKTIKRFVFLHPSFERSDIDYRLPKQTLQGTDST